MIKAAYIFAVVFFWLLVCVDNTVHAQEGKLSGRRSSRDLQQQQKVSRARGQRHSARNSAEVSGLRSTTRTNNRNLKEEDKDCGVDVGIPGGDLKRKKTCTTAPATTTTTLMPASALTPSTPPPTLSPVSIGVVATPRPTTSTLTDWFPPTLAPAPNQQTPTTTPPPIPVPVTQPSMSVATTAPQPISPSSIANPPERTTTSPPTLSPSMILLSRQPTVPTTAVVPTSNHNSTSGELLNKTVTTSEETGIVDTRLTCHAPIPDVASGVTDQLITYAYILNVVPGTVVAFILPEIEQVIQNEMSKSFLNCSFPTTTTSSALAAVSTAAASADEPQPSFFVHELSTAPVDELKVGCIDEERLLDAECYHISGFMRAVIFYLPTTGTAATNNSDPRLGQGPDHGRRKRFLAASQIEDPNVAEAFESWFEDFFASDDFLIHVNNSRVASLNFAGITNEYQEPPPPTTDESSSQNRTLVVVGAVLAGCVAVIVAALLVNHGIKKHQQRAEARFYQEAMDYVDEELDKDDENNNKDDGRSSTVTRSMIRDVVVVGEDETVHTGFPVLVDDGLRDPEDIRRDQNNYIIVQEYNNNSSRDVYNHQVDGVHFVSSVDPASMLEATKKDLGPARNDQVNSPRRYHTQNTVEL